MRGEVDVRTWLLVGCAVCITPTITQAQSSASNDGDVAKQLELMQEELGKLRTDNQSMKAEIDELRAKTDADWLTEARATEIKSLVADVLADADSRASLLQDGLMAGWSEHFFLASPDGRFLLQLEGQMQIRWIYNYRERQAGLGTIFPGQDAGPFDQHRNGFENTRTRLVFRGHVFSPDWQYLVRGDFARAGGTGAFNLLDAWVRYNLTDEWSVRVGQFKLPFNREELVSSAEQLAVERSLVNEVLNAGRSQGVELTFATNVSRFSLAYSDGASNLPFTANRANSAALVSDTEYAFTGRYEHLFAGTWNQFSDFTSPPDEESGILLGIAAHAESSESAGVENFFGTQQSTRVVVGTADISFEFGGANVFAALTHSYGDAPAGQLQVTGVVVQGGIYFTPKWEAFLRGEYANVHASSGNTTEVPDLNLFTFGVSYYIDGHDLKWTNDLSVGISDVAGAFASDLAGFRANADETAPQVVFRSQFQLLF